MVSTKVFLMRIFVLLFDNYYYLGFMESIPLSRSRLHVCETRTPTHESKSGPRITNICQYLEMLH